MKKISKYSATLTEDYRGITFEFENLDNAADFIRTAAAHHVAEDTGTLRVFNAEITPIYGEGEEVEVSF